MNIIKKLLSKLAKDKQNTIVEQKQTINNDKLTINIDNAKVYKAKIDNLSEAIVTEWYTFDKNMQPLPMKHMKFVILEDPIGRKMKLDKNDLIYRDFQLDNNGNLIDFYQLPPVDTELNKIYVIYKDINNRDEILLIEGP